MHAKALMACDDIIVEDTKRAKMHIRWIIIVCERKEVLTLEPIMASSKSTTSWNYLDFHSRKYRQKESYANGSSRRQKKSQAIW
jgi:hypothetical protein